MEKQAFQQLCKEKHLTGVEAKNLVEYVVRHGGVEDDLVDFVAELDSTLTYSEMFDHLKTLYPPKSEEMKKAEIANALMKADEQARQARIADRQQKEEELLQEVLKQTDHITNEMWGQREVVIREINEWNLHSAPYTWLVLFWLMKTGNFNVQLVGHKGTGKSRSIRALPKKLGIDAHVIYGHRSPLEFYGEVYEQKENLIAVEEAEVLQSNSQIKEMFRTGFYYPNIFEWRSTHKKPDGIPDQFEFSGSVCFGTNGLQSTDNPHVDASYDRFFICNIKHTNKQIREKQKHKRGYTPNDEVLKLVGDRIRLIQNKVVTAELTEKDYELIDLLMDEAYSDASHQIRDVYSKDKSVRDIEKLESIAICAKMLFGSLGDKAVVNVVKDAFFSLGVEPRNHIVHMVRMNDIKHKELVDHISWNEAISQRTAYRRVEALISEGKLRREGHYIKAVV